MIRLCLALAALALSAGGCRDQGDNATATRASIVPVTIVSGDKRHMFAVEVARTGEEQARGLMFRTDIADDGGMLFAPYPPEGGPPREASFWMKDTPTALDIIFIRQDGTIARIAADTTPYSELPVSSGEPVAAVLEVRAGRAAALGIAEGDRVSWAK